MHARITDECATRDRRNSREEECEANRTVSRQCAISACCEMPFANRMYLLLLFTDRQYWRRGCRLYLCIPNLLKCAPHNSRLWSRTNWIRGVRTLYISRTQLAPPPKPTAACCLPADSVVHLVYTLVDGYCGDWVFHTALCGHYVVACCCVVGWIVGWTQYVHKALTNSVRLVRNVY